MFIHFEKSHEDALSNALHNRKTACLPDHEGTLALNRCLGDIVAQLKNASDPSLRRELRSLYEGVNIACEFIARCGRDE